MAGYPISELKKASQAKGRDQIPLQQDGVTRQVELGIMDNAVKVTASTSSGLIYKEGSYVLQNNSAVINFTLDNAVGRELSGNSYVDSASAAAGWIVKVINLSTRSHTVIYGSNSWSIAAGEIQEYYWTGSAWTKYVSQLEESLSTYITESAATLNSLNIGNKKSKMFYVSGIAGGVYNGSDFCLIASKYNDSYQMQMAFSYGANTKVKERKCVNGTWTNWNELVTENSSPTLTNLNLNGTIKPNLNILNTLNTTDYFIIPIVGGTTGCPSGVNYGVCVTFQWTTNQFRQLVISAGKLAQRNVINGSFQDWYSVNLTKE